MNDQKFDVAVIGAGPGGYVAAIRAAQNNLSVVCIEKGDTLGGTCLNVGCIPSKALLHSSEIYHKLAHEGREHGIEYSQLTVNLAQMMARKNSIVSKLTQGIGFLFKKNGVAHIQAEANLLGPNTVQVGDRVIEARHIILATGSEPIALPFLPFDEKRVLSSTGALDLDVVPKKMVIVGAGIIGLELGSFYRRLGCEVEVVELLERITPGMDLEMSQSMQKILQKQGFTFHLARKVVEGQVQQDRVILKLDNGETREADVALVAIGRRPYFQGLGLKEVGIEQDRQGRVVIDPCFRTAIPTIFAIGDLVEGAMLAHKASEEGMAVADLIAGKKSSVHYLTIPSVMYSWPEVASVGLTEEEAQEAGLEILIGKMPFKAVPRARCSGDEEGFVKILGEKKSGRLIGLHLIGPYASEMIHEGVMALEKRMTLSEIAHASHAHPTCSEAIKEAALAAQGLAIHL